LAFLPIVVALAMLGIASAPAQEPRPKLGPDATTIEQSHGYLRGHEAPHYWALSPYYLPQFTDSACSVAAIAMSLNALRPLPPHADDPLITQQGLLEKVGSDVWAKKTAQGGSGVTWSEFVDEVRASLAAYAIAADVEVFKPEDQSPAALARLRRLLAEYEASDRGIVLVYFDQRVLTGDWDGPHISPIAAYDAELRRVLVMDVDRQWYIPYWSSEEKLLAAMLRPAPPSLGLLEGQTGGLVRITPKAAQ
jgi:hypothetical protein